MYVVIATRAIFIGAKQNDVINQLKWKRQNLWLTQSKQLTMKTESNQTKSNQVKNQKKKNCPYERTNGPTVNSLYMCQLKHRDCLVNKCDFEYILCVDWILDGRAMYTIQLHRPADGIPILKVLRPKNHLHHIVRNPKW